MRNITLHARRPTAPIAPHLASSIPLMEHRRSARPERRRQLAVAQSPARLPLRASSTFVMCVAQTQTQLGSLNFGP